MADIFKKYLECFENLDKNNIDKLLNCMSEQIIFVDPFNKLVGKDKVGSMLRYMFKKLENPYFKIIYVTNIRKVKIVKWEFSCRFLKKKNSIFWVKRN